MKAVKKLVAGLGLTVALGLGATAAQASEGGCGTYKTVEGKDAHLACETAPVDLTNKASIQRGASLFMSTVQAVTQHSMFATQKCTKTWTFQKSWWKNT